jgi:fused signal recognition particle receptor
MGFFDKLRAGLKRTAESLSRGLGTVLVPGAKVSPQLLVRLEEQLILADVGVSTARSLLDDMTRALPIGEDADSTAVREALRGAILRRLQKTAPPPGGLTDPVAVFLVGVNGVGKTTTAGKLAALWAGEGLKVLLAAGDTFRAAAEEQLTEWAKRAKVRLIRGEHEAAPAAIVFDALKSAVSQGFDRVVVDTAGRLHTRSNLMEELRKVMRSADKAAPDLPKERWLVVDAGTGQNALSQAREFHEAVGLTGLVLTKMDGTAKGGVAVALAEQSGLTIRYVGVGEGPEDLLPFDAGTFAEALIPQG